MFIDFILRIVRACTNCVLNFSVWTSPMYFVRKNKAIVLVWVFWKWKFYICIVKNVIEHITMKKFQYKLKNFRYFKFLQLCKRKSYKNLISSDFKAESFNFDCPKSWKLLFSEIINIQTSVKILRNFFRNLVLKI